MNWTKKILVANAAVLALWAVSAQATTNEAIAERLKPVGEVCIQGQECKGVGAVAAAALPRSRALRQVTAANPHGAVFLAKRQPYEISDLATFVGQAQDILDQVADRWVVASVDDRGISAWSIEPTSHELLLMPWEAIGYIERCYDPASGGFRYQPGSKGPGFARTAAGACVLQLTGQYEAKQIPKAIEYLEKTFDAREHFWYGHYYAA